MAGEITDISSGHACGVFGGHNPYIVDYFSCFHTSAEAFNTDSPGSGNLTFTATSDIFWLTLIAQGTSSSFMISDNLSLTGIVHPYITNSTNKNYAEGEFSKIIPLASRTEVSAKSNIGQDLSTDGTFSVVDPKSITLTTDSILDNHHDGNSVYGNFSKVLVNAGRVLLVPTTKEVLPRVTTINNQYSATFDGVNDYIGGIGNCPTGNFTISAWIKKEGAGGYYAIYSAASVEIWFGASSSEALRIHIGGNSSYKDTADGVINEGQWHHCAVTWDGSNAVIYVDGVSKSLSGAESGTLHTPVAGAGVIGAYPATSNYWDGNIDEVSIWDKALSRDEIRYHLCDYNYDNSNSVRPMDLTLHDTFATNCQLWMRMGD